jgi:hypothetical protein
MEFYSHFGAEESNLPPFPYYGNSAFHVIPGGLEMPDARLLL